MSSDCRREHVGVEVGVEGSGNKTSNKIFNPNGNTNTNRIRPEQPLWAAHLENKGPEAKGTVRAPRPPTQKEAIRLADRLALSVEEAAVAVGVSERHLRTLLPQIPHTYLGSRIVIPVDAFRRWLEQRATVEPGRVDKAVTELLDSIIG